MQQGLPTEYGPLPDKTKTATKRTGTMTAVVSPAAVVIQPPREPPTFHISPETWIETLERVSRFNNWDYGDKLRHVYFCLEGAARTWFENRESTLRTWDVFRSAFLETFANVVLKERAAALLDTPVQLPNEILAIFAEEMTRQFRYADPAMPDDKKVRFILRGVKQELFAGLMRNPRSTAQEFVRSDDD